MVFQFSLILISWSFYLSYGSPPNIIFFLTDDMGYSDVGFQSDNEILTPSIDFLRNEGQYLDWFYVQPSCSPTRASLMTGRYPLHHGVYRPGNVAGAAGLPLKFKLFPQILSENGYATHMIGKWHLGFYKWSYTPTFRGFDSFYGYYGPWTDYYTHIYEDYYDFQEANEPNCGVDCTRTVSEAYDIYNVYSFTDRAISIIEQHDKERKPLFLYISYETPHSPTQVPQSYVDKYADSIQNETRRIYAGMLTIMDESIGNIIECLQNNGYMDTETGNTLILFANDNGGPLSRSGGYHTGASNWALRGGKQSSWEGGTRVNGILYGTNDQIPANKAGTTYSQLMHIVDLFPTLLTAANIDYTQYVNINDDQFDGIDHWIGLSQNTHPLNKHFEYRQQLYYTPTTEELTDGGFRNHWNKIYNGTGGSPDGYCCDQNMINLPFRSNNDNNNDTKINWNHWNRNDNKSVALGPTSLYNLNIDPYEHWNVSQENPGLVELLWNMMRHLEETAVPAVQRDQTCPPIIHPIDPVLQIGIWTPWCGD